MRPCSRMAARYSGLKATRARAMPSRTAPAVPFTPPPLEVTMTSHCLFRFRMVRGCSTIISRMALAKNSVKVRSLMMRLPVPGLMITRAMAVLRRPVALMESWVAMAVSSCKIRPALLGSQRLGLLGRVGMAFATVNEKLAAHVIAQDGLGQHGLDGVTDRVPGADGLGLGHGQS